MRTNKRLTKAEKISLYLKEFISNNDEFSKLDDEEVRLRHEYENKIDEITKRMDKLNKSIIDRQIKLEKLGIDENLLIDACGYHGDACSESAINYLKTMI